ncbi:hypothetical protein [Marinicella sp. W31]|uniref:hypothetical protein n=1 Tax=Marinicella sp. W31 TaxID=3023713 RepID=UPI00375637DC
MLEAIQQNWVFLTIVGSVLLFVLPWLWILKVTRTRKRILKYGMSKPARIMSYKPSMFKFGKHAGSEFMQGVDLLIEINPGEIEAYKVKTRSVIHISEFSKLHSNMMIKVKVDPNKKDRALVEEWFF